LNIVEGSLWPPQSAIRDSKVVVAILVKISLPNIVGNKFYIPKKYRLIELRVQGGYLQKIDFSKIT
jgi:hypothetical protein